MPRNHNSMGYANHMQEIFQPCPPDEKSESEAILSSACFPFMFSLCLFACSMFSIYAFYAMRI